MERTKPNLSAVGDSVDMRTHGESLLYSQFKKQFQILLLNSHTEGTRFGKIFRDYQNGISKIYVREGQEGLEDKLRNFATQEGDHVLRLVGLTGVGKTTLLKNVFKIETRNPFLTSSKFFDAESDMRNKVEFPFDTLILYHSFFGDGALSDDNIDQNIASKINGAVVLLEQNYFKRNRAYIQSGEKFYDNLYLYINENKAEFFANHLVDNIQASNDSEKRKQLLSKIENENTLEFALFRLKFYLAEYFLEIRYVLIILDDIEAAQIQMQDHLIQKYVHIRGCLQYSQARCFTKLIISCRNYTQRMFGSRYMEAYEPSDVFAGYGKGDLGVVEKNEFPTLSAVIYKRFRYIDELLRKYPKDGTRSNEDWSEEDEADFEIAKELQEIGSSSTWKRAYEVLQLVCQRLDWAGGNLILHLGFFDLRKSLAIFLRVLSNKKYFSIEAPAPAKGGAVKIQESDYVPKPDAIFRAFSYGEGSVYRPESNEMPNILYNDNELDLICPLIIIYYLSTNSMNDPRIVYGKEKIQGKVFLDHMKTIFPSNPTIVARFEKGMKYLFGKRILLQSIYDSEPTPQEVLQNTAEAERNWKPEMYLYLSSRGLRLWQFLAESSLLLELYRDDLYIRTSHANKLTVDLGPLHNRLLDIYEMLGDWLREERKIIISSDAIEYKEYFGNSLIVRHLLEGVLKTIKTFYQEKDDEREIALGGFQKIDRAVRSIESEFGFCPNCHFCSHR